MNRLVLFKKLKNVFYGHDFFVSVYSAVQFSSFRFSLAVVVVVFPAVVVVIVVVIVVVVVVAVVVVVVVVVVVAE